MVNGTALFLTTWAYIKGAKAISVFHPASFDADLCNFHATRVYPNTIKLQVNATELPANATKVQVNATELPANATKVQVNAKNVSIKESFKQMRWCFVHEERSPE